MAVVAGVRDRARHARRRLHGSAPARARDRRDGAPRLAAAPAMPRASAALRRSAPFRALLSTFLLQGLATGLMLAARQLRRDVGAALRRRVDLPVRRPDRPRPRLRPALGPHRPPHRQGARIRHRERAVRACGALADGDAVLGAGPWVYAARRPRRRGLRRHAVAADGHAARRDRPRRAARRSRVAPARSAACGQPARPPEWRSAPRH